MLIISAGSYTANWLSYLLGMTQHCGLKENDTDFRKSVRSIKINPFTGVPLTFKGDSVDRR